ncbi:hypothetical protein E1301_Tti009318 [Triplophysa tibetana]|uniref:HAT C-terminal dimerisation domain-containing protein n=1 Tax=Triplophysa tibetana TaxID=1572043 RepID=A0A5A9NU87_9TELE|nr:hypothetical protein E1301_Tti009318 [Triplophysa tibetana]
MRQAFPEEAFQSVLKSYGHHFDSGRLRSELQVLYSDQDLQSNRGKLCDYLVFLKDMELDSAMPQLYKLFSLVATIGATSAGVERSFSCLKRLKSYTRNTMGQGRLSSLALLAIEKTLVKSLEKTPSCSTPLGGSSDSSESDASLPPMLRATSCLRHASFPSAEDPDGMPPPVGERSGERIGVRSALRVRCVNERSFSVLEAQRPNAAIVSIPLLDEGAAPKRTAGHAALENSQS